MLRIRRKVIAEKYSTFNERLDQALCCAPVRRRHSDLFDRSKPLLSRGDSVWRSATIHRKRDSMMGEWNAVPVSMFSFARGLWKRRGDRFTEQFTSFVQSFRRSLNEGQIPGSVAP